MILKPEPQVFFLGPTVKTLHKLKELKRIIYLITNKPLHLICSAFSCLQHPPNSKLQFELSM
jgi:hypothetical protein